MPEGARGQVRVRGRRWPMQSSQRTFQGDPEGAGQEGRGRWGGARQRLSLG